MQATSRFEQGCFSSEQHFSAGGDFCQTGQTTGSRFDGVGVTDLNNVIEWDVFFLFVFAVQQLGCYCRFQKQEFKMTDFIGKTVQLYVFAYICMMSDV